MPLSSWATLGGVTAGNTVFDLTVNSSTGNVTLSQYSAIEHDGPGTTSNFDTQEAVLGTGLAYLNATATITDHDGDTHEDVKSIDLGGNVAFDDDGPSVTQAAPTDTVVVNTQDADTEGSATDTDLATSIENLRQITDNLRADRRGEPDLTGRPLEVTEVGFADAAVVAVEAGAEAASVVVDSADLAAVVVEVAALPVDGKASMNYIDNKKPLQCCRGFLL